MSSFAIKILAMLTMLIDHIGAAFEFSMPYSVYLACRIIGRLAMPLFCFMIAEGLFHTRDAKRYMIRLAIFALVSEVPFDLLFMNETLEFWAQNVGITLFFGLLGILLFDTFAAQGHKGAALIAILAAGAAAHILRADYGMFGVYYVFIFYYFRSNKWGRTIALAAGVFLLMWTSHIADWYLAIGSTAAVLAAIPIALYNGERGRENRSVRTVFYAFYPAHLFILYALTYVVG